MIVTGAPFESGRTARRLDAAGQASPGKGAEHVVNSLDGYRIEAAANTGRYLLYVEVAMVGVEDFEYGKPWSGDP
jgi:hypothetical protein